jgi:hypothetical protein
MKKRIHPDLFRTPIYSNYLQLENYTQNKNIKSLIYYQDMEIKQNITHVLKKLKYKIFDFNIIRSFNQLNINIQFFNKILNETPFGEVDQNSSYSLVMKFMRKFNFYKYLYLRSMFFNFTFLSEEEIKEEVKIEIYDEDDEYKEGNLIEEEETQVVYKKPQNFQRYTQLIDRYSFRFPYPCMRNVCNAGIEMLRTANEYLQFGFSLNLMNILNKRFCDNISINTLKIFIDRNNKLYNIRTTRKLTKIKNKTIKYNKIHKVLNLYFNSKEEKIRKIFFSILTLYTRTNNKFYFFYLKELKYKLIIEEDV